MARHLRDRVGAAGQFEEGTQRALCEAEAGVPLGHDADRAQAFGEPQLHQLTGLQLARYRQLGQQRDAVPVPGRPAGRSSADSEHVTIVSWAPASRSRPKRSTSISEVQPGSETIQQSGSALGVAVLGTLATLSTAGCVLIGVGALPVLLVAKVTAKERG